MRMTFLLGLCVALAACGGGSGGDEPDSGGGTDSGSGADSGTLDAAPADGSTMADAAPGDGSTTADAAPGDASTTPDAASGDASTTPDGSTAACAGVECTGFPTTVERGCTLGADGADVNCAAELHQTDCCGTMRALGMNHGVVGTAFCPAEATCRGMYDTPAPCSAGPITLDTGDTTDDPTRIHVRCNIPADAATGTCETYLGDTTGGTGTCGP
ncbi:MAG: hypothetical protein GXP55_19730 [Deltaproteobacteria bacterium]|nr:hypothetical protein [Deltaproteobacteria bacterium]